MRLSVLMTAYNEADFIDYSIRSCLDYVDEIIVVEGSYLENQKLGKSPRSTDGTVEIIEKYRTNPKVHIIYTNQQSDPQQRNVGVNKAKELGCDWLLIIDRRRSIYAANTNAHKTFNKEIRKRTN